MNIPHIYVYTNLPVSHIVRLPHPRSGDSLGQETFLAPYVLQEITVNVHLIKRDIATHINICST